MEIFSTILSVPIAQLFAVGLLIVILQRAGIDVAGLLKSLLGKNGKNGDRVTKKLEEIETNHLEHVHEGISELQRGQDKILFILEDFKDNGIKLRD